MKSFINTIRWYLFIRLAQGASLAMLLLISTSVGLSQQPTSTQPARPVPQTQTQRQTQSPQKNTPTQPNTAPAAPPTSQSTEPNRTTPTDSLPPLATPTPTTMSPASQTGTPSASPTPANALLLTTTPQTNQTTAPLTLDEAVRLSGAQASAFQQAGLNERIAAEDVRQARAAFLPRVTTPLDFIYTTPSFNTPQGETRAASFIAANAISEYQALLSVTGELDLSGRLRATLERNRALLAAARAGTNVARRTLAQATVEAYYGLALAAARRRTAEQNLAVAEEFERNTGALLSAGEVAPVDLTRAQLQTTQRRGELEGTRADEAIAGDALRVLVGYDLNRPIETADLSMNIPTDGDIERITNDTITGRPEFAQFEAERRAAEQDIKIARAERLPQVSYTINGGFDTDSLRPQPLKEHTGVSGAVSVSIPIFDFGASRSRERQVRLRAEVAESQRLLAIRGFYQEFNTARTSALSAAVRIRLAGTGIAQAQSNLNASVARYRAGETSIIEVTDAQTTLAAQRLALLQAIFDYQTARARLLQAAGQ